METTRFSLSTIFTVPIQILFVYYGFMFLKINFSMKKGGNNKDNKLKAIAILSIVIVNLILAVITHPVINIVSSSIIMPYWVWINGLSIILLHVSWTYKYDKTLVDAYKQEGYVSKTNMT